MSSVWQGGNNTTKIDRVRHSVAGTGMKGLGDGFVNKTVGTMFFGTISGGAAAAVSGGNFWQGAVTGLVVSGLNHGLHETTPDEITEENIRDRFNSDLSPDGKPEFTQEGINKVIKSVRGLSGAKRSNNPNLKFKFDPDLPYAGLTDSEVQIRLNPNEIKSNAHMAVLLFHEMRHAWQWYSGLIGHWDKKYGIGSRENLMERDAYWFQIKVGGGSYYDGYYRYEFHKSLTSFTNGNPTPKNISKTWHGN